LKWIDPFAYAFKNKTNRIVEYGFYYYGKYAMVRFIIGCLSLSTPEGYEMFLKNCSEYGDDCSKCLDKETASMLFADSKRILLKTYLRHPIVNAYCNYVYKQENLDSTSRKELKNIIDSAEK
jgi:hypothetical protein